MIFLVYNLAGIFGHILLLQLQQDGLHPGHVFNAILVRIFATKVT